MWLAQRVAFGEEVGGLIWLMHMGDTKIIEMDSYISPMVGNGCGTGMGNNVIRYIISTGEKQ